MRAAVGLARAALGWGGQLNDSSASCSRRNRIPAVSCPPSGMLQISLSLLTNLGDHEPGPLCFLCFLWMEDQGTRLWKSSFNCAQGRKRTRSSQCLEPGGVGRPRMQVLSSQGWKRNSRCGAVETNPTRIHEVAGSIPGLAPWVKDLVLQ